MTPWNEMVLAVKQSVGIETPTRGGLLEEPAEMLPIQRMDGRILLRGKVERCRLQERECINHGRYGLIQLCTRTAAATAARTLVIKRPKRLSYSQIPEALIQQVAYEVLRRRGIHGAIPEVVDLYMFAHEERFTMELIEGISLDSHLEEFAATHTRAEFSEHCMDLLIQLCVLLFCLETDMDLDHRDLSPSNIWVRKERKPFEYRLRLPSGDFRYSSTTQIVLLDFGFCCLGGGRGVSLGGVIPRLDPCPKEGRDILTLLNRLYNDGTVRQSLTLELTALWQSWCEPYLLGEDAYKTLLDTSAPKFRLEALHTRTLLEWWRLKQMSLAPSLAPSL
jgi:serine/threonine protein kinase